MVYSKAETGRWPRFVLGLALLAASLLITRQGFGQVSFGTPTAYPVGSQPGAVATGDFNGDGHLDLVVTNAGNQSVSVLLGNGDGTFRSAVDYPVGPGVGSIVVVDLNLDNKMDLAIAFHGDVSSLQPGGVSVFLGNGNGTFQSATSLASDDYPTAIASGDFNGDNKPDLAISNIDGSASVYLGNGDGTFRTAVNYPVTGDALWLGVGDLNGDGKPDLLVTTSISSATDKGNASVFLGNGDGSFQPAIETPVGDGFYGAIGDFNGDHKLDLAFITKSNVFAPASVAVAMGKGDGTFEAAAPVGALGSSLISADLNADGLSDLVTLSSLGAQIFLAQSNGTFQLAQTIVFGAGGPVGVTAGDFNGDQLPDLALTMSPQNVVDIFLNTAAGFSMNLSALMPEAVTAGQSASSTLSTTASNGFSGTVSFICSVSPAPPLGPQCAINPNTVAAGGAATLTVTSTAPQGKTAYVAPPGLLHSLPFLLGSLTLLGMFVGTQRKKTRIFGSTSSLVMVATLLILPGCGGADSGNPHGSPGTAAGTYTITVTGTSGSTTHSTSVMLKVM